MPKKFDILDPAQIGGIGKVFVCLYKRKDGTMLDAQLSARLVENAKRAHSPQFVEGLASKSKQKPDSLNLEDFLQPVARSLQYNASGLNYITSQFMDVMQRERLEREIVEIIERERQRIGQDLHDSLGQLLTGIAFISSVLEQKLAAKSLAEADYAAKITKIVIEAITQTRSLAKTLNPVGLEADGLVLALEELVNNIEKIYNISCMLECDNPVFVSDNFTATHIYRIAQEAVNNAIRHGKAKNILIRLIPLNSRFIMSIKDDGLGFQQTSNYNKGMGLDIMKRRAEMIGASLNIRKNTDCGTIVVCSFKQDEIVKSL